MKRTLAFVLALAPLSGGARASDARGELGVTCQVIPAAAFRADVIASAGGDRADLQVAARSSGRAGWFVSGEGEAVLVRIAAEGSPAPTPAGEARVVVTVFPDGAPERVVVVEDAGGPAR